MPDGFYYLSAGVGGNLFTGWYFSSDELHVFPDVPEYLNPNLEIPPYSGRDFRIGYNDGYTVERAADIDGSTAQIALDINPAGSSDPAGFTEYNGRLYFRATDSSGDTDLWVMY